MSAVIPLQSHIYITEAIRSLGFRLLRKESSVRMRSLFISGSALFRPSTPNGVTSHSGLGGPYLSGAVSSDHYDRPASSLI